MVFEFKDAIDLLGLDVPRGESMGLMAQMFSKLESFKPITLNPSMGGAEAIVEDKRDGNLYQVTVTLVGRPKDLISA